MQIALDYAYTFEEHRKYFRWATKAVSSGFVSTFIFCIILHQAVNEEQLLVQIYIDVEWTIKVLQHCMLRIFL